MIIHKKLIRILRDKKADDSMIMALVKIILAALAIVLILFMVNGVYDSLFSDINREGSMNDNFKSLGMELHNLIKNEDTHKYVFSPLFIDDKHNYVIVGFDTDWTSMRTAEGNKFIQSRYDTYGPVIRPTRCGNNGCLCMYKGDIVETGSERGAKRDENVVDCIVFSQKVSFQGKFEPNLKLVGNPGSKMPFFTSPAKGPAICGAELSSSQIPKTGISELDKSRRGFLFMYGKGCGVWDAQKMYIEKFEHMEHNSKHYTFYFEIYQPPTKTELGVQPRIDAIDTFLYEKKEKDAKLVPPIQCNKPVTCPSLTINDEWVCVPCVAS